MTHIATKAIRREPHATPTLNELKAMLSRAKIFSELDHNQGYNQLKLAEESRYITTMQHTWDYTDTNTYSSVNRQQDFP